MQKQTFVFAPPHEALTGGPRWTAGRPMWRVLLGRVSASAHVPRHHESDLKVWFQLRVALNRWEPPNLWWKNLILSFPKSAAFETRWRKSGDRWSRTQIFSIRAASLPLDGIGQNSIYKWPLNGCVYQIIAACRFRKMRLIRTSVEK